LVGSASPVSPNRMREEEQPKPKSGLPQQRQQ
jgi:hypothetical protein